MHKLALYTTGALTSMAHYVEMLTDAENAYATTSVQLNSLSEPENVVVIPNTFREAMGLPETAIWKIAQDKDRPSAEKHDVLDLIPPTSIPAGQKSVVLRWVYKSRRTIISREPLLFQGWG